MSQVFKPDVKNSVNLSAKGDVRLKGDLTELSESVISITEDSDSYDVELESRDELEESSKNTRSIPKDWVNSVNLSNNSISYYPPSNYCSEYDVEIIDKEVVSETDNGITRGLVIEAEKKDNELTEILKEDDIQRFKENYYFKEREITENEFDELKQELKTVPLKETKKGGAYRIKDVDENDNLFKFAINLNKENRSFAEARFKTGNHSVTWSVSSQTDWEGATNTKTDITIMNGELSKGQTKGIRWNIGTDTWTQIKADGETTTLTPSDFNNIYPFSEMTKANVAPDGTINAWYGDADYAEDGSNGRVMTVIPKFYYKSTSYTDGDGNKVVEFYTSNYNQTGYELHPSFSQRISNPPADALMIGAYEASAYSEDGGTTWKLASRAGVTPVQGSGDYTGLNGNTLDHFDIEEARQYGNNIGENWGIMNIWSHSAVKMLFAVEYGSLDSQTELGRGIVDLDSGTGFAGKQTAADNINSNLNEALTGTGDQADGETPVAYRGIENLWGNVWQFTDGYEAVDSEYRILDPSGDWTTEGPDGWTSSDYITSNTAPITDNDGYISDIETESALLPLMIPSATGGSSSEYIPDYIFSHDSGENNILKVGGAWHHGDWAGVSYLPSNNGVGNSFRNSGARAEFLKSSAPSVLQLSGSKWSSTVWDAGTSNKQKLDTLTVNDTIGTNESVEVRLSVDEDDDGAIEKTSSWVSLSDGTNTLNAGDFDIDTLGYRYQLEYRLEVIDSDTSHTPSVQDYSLTVDDTVTLSGTVTVGGSTFSGVDVYAWNETSGEFVGHTTTDSSGNYSFNVALDSVILVAVDYYDSGSDTYYGDEKSVVT